MDPKDLIRERVKLHEENKQALDKASAEKRTLTGEEQAQYDARSKRMGELKEHLARIEETAADERALAESMGRRTETTRSDGPVPTVSVDEQNMALRAWALGSHARPEQLEAAHRVGLRLGSEIAVRGIRMRTADGRERIESRVYETIGAEQYRALSVGTTTAGGNAVPDELMRAYMEMQKAFGPVRQVAEVIETETGATLPWPTVDDTSNTGEIIAEASAITTTADPSFGVVNIGAFKFSSKAVLVSVELLQDCAFNLATYLGGALGRRIGRIQNDKFSVGAGTTEPAGLVTRASVGKTCSATNVFTADEIIDLTHAVDPAYRGPSARFQASDTILATIRKLKDGTGRYIWEPSMQLGQPDRLMGIPVLTNNDMSTSLATAERVLIYGDPYNYKVRDAGPVVLARSEHLYMLTHQIVFAAFQRSDGNLVDTTSVKYMRLA